MDYVHILMYVVLVVKPAYIYTLIGLKFMCIIFHMFLGMVKETSKDKKWSMGSKEFAVGQGSPYKV